MHKFRILAIQNHCVALMTDPLSLGKTRHIVLEILPQEFQDDCRDCHHECWNETILNKSHFHFVSHKFPVHSNMI